MTAISKIPGMNAMALFHDQCAVYFDMNALASVGTIPPAIVFTYIGTGTQMYDLIQKTASEKSDGKLNQLTFGNSSQGNSSGNAFRTVEEAAKQDATAQRRKPTRGGGSWDAEIVVRCKNGSAARDAAEAAAEATFEAAQDPKVNRILVVYFAANAGSKDRYMGSAMFASAIRDFDDQQIARWTDHLEKQVKAMPGGQFLH